MRDAIRHACLTFTLLAVLTSLVSPKGWMPGRDMDGRIGLVLCASVGPPPPTVDPKHAAKGDHHGVERAVAPDPMDHAAHHAPPSHVDHAAHDGQPLAQPEPEHEHDRPHQTSSEMCAWAGQHAGPPATAPPPPQVPLGTAATQSVRWTPHAAPNLPRLAPPPPATAPPLRV